MGVVHITFLMLTTFTREHQDLSMSEAIRNEDAVVETIAKAIDPGLWSQSAGYAQRQETLAAARRVIGALGLTEEQKVGPYVGPDAREFGHVRSRLVTPWKEDEE